MKRLPNERVYQTAQRRHYVYIVPLAIEGQDYEVFFVLQRAEEIIRAAAEGRDPQREKQEACTAITVAELCGEYLAAARAGLVTTRFRRPNGLRPSPSMRAGWRAISCP
ncbi:MAG: hypothetical protein ACREE4_16495 [Stellaceae bacterium]